MITANVYVHSSKESNYDLGETLGLTGEALENFMYTAHEVKLTYEVNPESGATRFIAVNDIPLGVK